MGTILHLRKFLPQRGTAWPFRSPRPKVGNIKASGEESLQSLRHVSMTGRTCSGTGIGALLCRVLSLPLYGLPKGQPVQRQAQDKAKQGGDSGSGAGAAGHRGLAEALNDPRRKP